MRLYLRFIIFLSFLLCGLFIILDVKHYFMGVLVLLMGLMLLVNCDTLCDFIRKEACGHRICEEFKVQDMIIEDDMMVQQVILI